MLSSSPCDSCHPWLISWSTSWTRSPSPRPARSRPSASRSGSRAGSAPAATPRAASASSSSTTAPARATCRSSPPAELPNYESRGQAPAHRRQRHRRGRGQGVAGQGPGHRGACRRSVDRASAGADPETYPLQKKGHTFEFLRTIAHLRPRTNTFGAIARLRNQVSQVDPRVLPGAGLPLRPHADHHRQRLRGGRRDVPRHDARPGQAAARPRARSTYTKDFFGKPAFLTVSGQLQARSSPARWARSTPSARRSGPRTRTRRGTSPSSG